MEITSVLPKGINYKTGSTALGEYSRNFVLTNEEPEVIHNLDDTTTLKWSGVSSQLTNSSDRVYLSFKTTFDEPNLDGNKSFNIKATFKVPFQEKESVRFSYFSLNDAVTPKEWGIRKSVNKKILEQGDDFTYRLTTDVRTKHPQTNIRVLDVLPKNGELDSVINGSYRLSEIVKSTEDMDVYYTNKKVDRNADPKTIDTTTGWTKYTSGALPADTTAVYYVIPGPISSSTDGGKQEYIEFHITPTANASGDTYNNTVTANSDDDIKVLGNTARTAVVDREINGKAWIDGNKNNAVDDGETILKNVPVRLYEKATNGTLEIVKVNKEGTDISNIKTDEQGNYHFPHLDAGDYVVGFDLSKEMATGSYYLAPKDPYPGYTSSKINANEKDEDFYLTDAYTLPETKDMTSSTFILNNINAGITAYGDLEIEKSVWNTAGENIDGQNVQIGDTITYKLKVKNPIADSMIDNIRVSDTLPKGLEYITDSSKIDGEEEENPTIQDQKLVYDLKSLIGKKESTIEFNVKVTKDAEGTLVNKAEVQGKDDSIDISKSDEKDNKLDANPSIEKTIENPKQNYMLGDTVTYKIKATNKNGSILHGARIEDLLSKNLTYVKDSTTINSTKVKDAEVWSGESNNQFTYSADALNSEDEMNITFQAKITGNAKNSIIKNEAILTGQNAWGEEKEAKSEVELAAAIPANAFELSKHVYNEAGEKLDGKAVEVGSQVEYRIDVTNTIAGTTLTDFHVSDAIPSGLDVKAGSLKVVDQAGKAVAYTGDIQGGNLEVVLAEVSAGNPVEVRFEATINQEASGDLTNIAVGKTDGGDDKETDGENEMKVSPKPSITKTASVAKAKLGETYRYTIEVSNGKGGGKWQAIAVQDSLPAGVRYVSDSTKVNGEAVSDE
ncbi:cell surface protein, partial [Listeria grayi FSL F6-1183]